MAGNPGKPTNVDVAALKQVLTELEQLQGGIGEGRPGSWDSVGDGNAIAQDLKGMQENVAQQIGEYYGDVTSHVTKSWTAIQSGIATLRMLVDATISAHTGQDTHTAAAARAVNTTQQPAGAATKG